MKEASQPLELLVLEPEKNRLTLELNQKKIPIQTQMRIDAFFFRKIGNPDLIVVRKKKLGKKKKYFLLNVFLHFHFDDFFIFYYTNFYSTFPEFIFQGTPFKPFQRIPSTLFIL